MESQVLLPSSQLDTSRPPPSSSTGSLLNNNPPGCLSGGGRSPTQLPSPNTSTPDNRPWQGQNSSSGALRGDQERQGILGYMYPPVENTGMSNGATVSINMGERTFDTLQTAGRLFPVPSVAVAANVALSIVQEAQTVKFKKQEFITIGRDSCLVVEAVVRQFQVGRNGRILDDPVFLHIDVLVADLRYIEKCIKKIKRRSAVRKLLGHQLFGHLLEQITIRNCRDRLTGIMVLLGFQSDTETRRQLASMNHLLFTVLGALSDPSSPQIQPQPQWETPSAPLSDIFLVTPTATPAAPPLESRRSQETPDRTDRGWPESPIGSSSGLRFHSYQNTRNRGPDPGAGVSYVAGNVSSTRRDDSFNVFGIGNNIYLSLSHGENYV